MKTDQKSLNRLRDGAAIEYTKESYGKFYNPKKENCAITVEDFSAGFDTATDLVFERITNWMKSRGDTKHVCIWSGNDWAKELELSKKEIIGE